MAASVVAASGDAGNNVAAAPQADPTAASGAPQGDPGAGAPSAPTQAPASPSQIMLAQMYQLCKKLATQDPTLAPGLAKAAQGIQEAQTALVTQPAPQPASSNPPY